MTVAEIAWRDLKPAAKTRAMQLLAIGGDAKTRDFQGASCWADDYKTKENGPWHYINIHFRLDGAPTNNRPLEENVVWAINKFTATMKAPSRSDSDKAEALRFLMHFVGDVHQPLHAVACDSHDHPQGDRGGNDFVFDPVQIGDFEVKNLHFLWDFGGGLCGKVTRPGTNPQVGVLADKLTAMHPRNSFPGVGLTDPMAWAVESLELAKTVTYQLEEKKKPSPEYLSATQFASGRRIAVAGYRLADLLNSVLAQ